MSNRRKPPRLYWDATRRQWSIRDGSKTIRTGCGEGEDRAAEQRLEAYLAAKHRPDFGDGHPSRVLVADVVAAYAEHLDARGRDARTESVHMKHLLAHFGEMTVDAVTPAECRRYLRSRQSGRLGRPVVVNTVARELTTLRAALSLAYRNRSLLLPIPVPNFVEPARRERWLTRSEVAALLWGALGWVRQPDGTWKRTPKRGRRRNYYVARFILIAYVTGTRHEAVATIEWIRSTHAPSIDVETGIYHRRGSAEAETRKRRPSLVLPAFLLAHCRRWKTITVKGPIETRGRVTREIGDGFRTAARNAGLGDDVTPHTLKHSAVTEMFRAGLDIGVIAEWTGTSEATLREVYGHHHPEFQARGRSFWEKRR